VKNHLASLSILIVLGFAVSIEAQNRKQSTPPAGRATSAIRMDLRPKVTAAYTVGTKPDLVLRLFTPNGQAYSAPKDFLILVEALSSDGRVVHKESITLKKGKSEEEFDLDVDTLTLSGPIRVRTTHRELLEGGTILYGMPRKPKTPKVGDSGFVESRLTMVLARWARASLTEASYDVVPAALRFQQSSSPCGVKFMVAPGGSLWANGRDAAQLTLIVVEPRQRDTSFFVKTTLGHLTPNPIVIKAGQQIGVAQLTSETVGEAQITCVHAVPAVPTNEPADEATVKFTRLVTGFTVFPTPPRIPSIDRARITVRLLSGEGKEQMPIEADQKRTISLTSNKAGAIMPVEIEPPAFEGSSDYQPFERGPVQITAATPGFQDQVIDLEVVAIPLLLFLLPPLGGLCGGVLAAVHEAVQWRKAATSRQPASLTSLDGPAMRFVTAIITGALLQWAMVLEVLPILPRSAIMSPVSWFFVPMIGGWLGTEVFGLVLGQFGVKSKVSPSSV
jgi:hypothetical protein